MQTLSVTYHYHCFYSVGVSLIFSVSIFCAILLFPNCVELQKIPGITLISQIFSEEFTLDLK